MIAQLLAMGVLDVGVPEVVPPVITVGRTWQQSDLDTIRASIASGVLVTRFADGREIRYQTLDNLLAAERVISASLQMAAAATRGAVRRRFATYTSGL